MDNIQEFHICLFGCMYDATEVFRVKGILLGGGLDREIESIKFYSRS